jgi:hypothetical protein
MSRRELFRAEGVPVFQNKMFATREAALACPTGDVVLAQDTDTGLVFNAAFDAALLAYDSDYQNEQALSRVFQCHISTALDIIQRNFRGKSVIEVGCGKGHFLGYLQKCGYTATGIDPAYEGDNPDIRKARFDPSSGLLADGVVLRHVLEHIQDPLAFLASIAAANGQKGTIYIEVPCFDWICNHRSWFDVFYEHVNYFRLPDFYRMFGTVHEAGHVFGGQYLYAVADLSTLRTPRAEARDALCFPRDFTASMRRILSDSMTSRRRAIWGGAAKGMMFAFYMKRAGLSVDLIIDINPAKQGKFLAATGVRVSSPEEAMQVLQPGDHVLVMNSNYFDEVVAATASQFRYSRVDEYGLQQGS